MTKTGLFAYKTHHSSILPYIGFRIFIVMIMILLFTLFIRLQSKSTCAMDKRDWLLNAWVGIVCVIISLIKYEKSHRKHSREWLNIKLSQPTASGANHRGVCLWYWIKWLRCRNVNRNSGFMNMMKCQGVGIFWPYSYSMDLRFWV